MEKRKRRLFSFKNELVLKSHDAALSAVQIYNNPNIQFKSEIFIVLMIIAWTYLMHAFFRDKGIDYRYYQKTNKRKKYDRTSKGAYKYWELERCLNDKSCPLDNNVKNNLRFLIGIRHEIEHQMACSIDDFLSAKLQACCINYNKALKLFFGNKYAIENKLKIAIQFSGLSEEQTEAMLKQDDLPKNVFDFIQSFEKDLSDEERMSSSFSYKVIYLREAVNHENQADKAYRFVDEKSAEGKEIHNILVKPGKIPATYKPTQVVQLMRKKGYKFNITQHTDMWKRLNAKNQKLNYGTVLGDGQWYWYHSWVIKVEDELKKMLASEQADKQ